MRRDRLDVLEAQHHQEEIQQAERNLLDSPRIQKRLFPPKGVLSESQAWLERLYMLERMPRDKKPLVFDHLRSYGAWMTSVDRSPLCMLDGMSQTATLPFGFSDDRLVRAYLAGHFAETLQFSTDTSALKHPAQEAFEGLLHDLVPGFKTVCFSNSGAEANEKAFGLCWANRRSPSQRRVLAFEGCFHGRTLLALHATANPAKRGPYELPGYEATFIPFAVCKRQTDIATTASDELLERLTNTTAQEIAHSINLHADNQLAAELAALAALETCLQTDQYFACIIEPMQSEGGDRYGTYRFFQAVRVITRKYQVPLIIDEVQTGFGLGGTFAWHQQFMLRTATGKPDRPDCVTFGKRAQVGVVLTCFDDHEPSASHAASMKRGQLHTELLAGDPKAAHLETMVTARLNALADRHQGLLLHPRVKGYAMAFDLPTPTQCERYLSMRMAQGVMVLGAGDRTIRYRLSAAFSNEELDALFDAIDASLRALGRPSAASSTASTVVGHLAPIADLDRPRVRLAHVTERDSLLDAIIRIEDSVFEPARRDPRELLQQAFDHPDGLVAVAESANADDRCLLGACLAVPLEMVANVPGPDSDPNLGQNNTLYILSVVVDSNTRGTGVGRELKVCILNQCRKLVTASGLPRYLFQTGRNRIGHTEAMSNLNRSLGAYEVSRLTGQYGDPHAQASYYRIHLHGLGIDPPTADPSAERDLSQGISRPLLQSPSTFVRLLADGSLAGPTVTKLTLSNYVTPAVVRAVEWVSALCPELPHLYMTSSRDECIDKTLRCLRHHRTSAHVAIGLRGGYVGHTTAAARSLSDPAVHRAGAAYFDHWPLLTHPQILGVEQTIAQLTNVIKQAGGTEQVLGLFVEAVQERSGNVLDNRAWDALHDACHSLDVPLVLIETASCCYRSARGVFHSSPWTKQPTALVWWAGGQQGFIHMSPRYRVTTPLTMMSTWDGDELSLIRVHHQLRHARHLDIMAKASRMDDILTKDIPSGISLKGAGLYRVLDATTTAGKLAAYLHSQGWRCRHYSNDCISLAPALDVADSTLLTLGATLSNYRVCAS